MQKCTSLEYLNGNSQKPCTLLRVPCRCISLGKSNGESARFTPFATAWEYHIPKYQSIFQRAVFKLTDREIMNCCLDCPNREMHCHSNCFKWALREEFQRQRAEELQKKRDEQAFYYALKKECKARCESRPIMGGYRK